MPEGPFGGPRVSNFGPLSRSTIDDVRKTWRECPESGKPAKICKSIKYHSIAILEDQDFFADCDDIASINGGNCYNIAESVVDEVGGVRVFKAGDYDHVWISYNNKHYDAERPSGVTDYLDLPFFGRFPRYELLHFAQMAAEAEGEEPPQMFEDTVEDVTQEYA